MERGRAGPTACSDRQRHAAGGRRRRICRPGRARVPLVPNVGIMLGERKRARRRHGDGACERQSRPGSSPTSSPAAAQLAAHDHALPPGARLRRAGVRRRDDRLQPRRSSTSCTPRARAISRCSATFGDGVAAQLEGVELVEPDETYEGGVERIDLGGRHGRAPHIGRAHTRGDQVVFLPEERILFTGDLVEERCFAIFPWFPPDDADVDGELWIAALERLEALAPRIVVPGHGDVGGAEVIATVREYLVQLRDETRTSAEAGPDADAAAEQIDARCARCTRTGCSRSGSCSASVTSTPPGRASNRKEGTCLDSRGRQCSSRRGSRGRRRRSGHRALGRRPGPQGLLGRRGEPAGRLQVTCQEGRRVHDRIPEPDRGQRDAAHAAARGGRAGEGVRLQGDRARRPDNTRQAGEQHAAADRPERERDHLLPARSEGDGAVRSSRQRRRASQWSRSTEPLARGPATAPYLPYIATQVWQGRDIQAYPADKALAAAAPRGHGRPDRNRVPRPGAQVSEPREAFWGEEGGDDRRRDSGQPERRRHRRREGGERARPALLRHESRSSGTTTPARSGPLSPRAAPAGRSPSSA